MSVWMAWPSIARAALFAVIAFAATPAHGQSCPPGVIASTSQMAGVFTGVLRHEVHMAFLAPLFVDHLTLALRILVLGF